MAQDTTFNAQCYLQRYPDVAADPYFGANPEQHWLQYGQGEGRIPGCDDVSATATATTESATTTGNKNMILIAGIAVAAFFLFSNKKIFK